MRSVETGADAARVPPHDLDAERAVIGALLVSETAVAAVAEQLAPEEFYSEIHRVIYAAMMRLYSRGDRIDQITLTNELNSVNEFDRVGGRAYIFQLVESVPTASNAARYAEIVRGKALLRSVIDVGSRITEDAFREPEDVTEALDSAEQLIYGVSNRTLKQHLAPVSELAPGALEMIQRLYEQEGEVTGVETGFEDLDRLTTGFHKSDLVVLAARPAMGKCLSADAEIVLDDGSVRTIEEIFHRQSARLMTLDDGMKLSWACPSAFIDDGVKPVYKVTTRLGRTIKTTLTHPFLTMDGWRRLGELSVGDHVAVPRRMPVFGSEPLGTDRIKLLAYMLGDGNMTGGTPRFTNANPRVRRDFSVAAEGFGGLRVRTETSGGTRTPTLYVCADRAVVRRHRQDFAGTLRDAVLEAGRPAHEVAGRAGVSPASVTNWSMGKTVPDAATALRLHRALSRSSVALEISDLDLARTNVPNALRRWLDGLGLWGCGAKEKYVPESVFRAPREELSLFLNRLFATDGWAVVLSSGQAQVGYSSVSEKLARQVQHLLLRFGVISSLRERSVRYKDTRRPAFQLDITGADSIRTFIEEIGIFGKEDATCLVSDALEDRHPHSNRDLVPHEVWKLIDEARGMESWGSLARRMGHGPGHNFHVGTRALSRGRLARFAEALDDDRLRDLAASDMYWDSIVGIEPLGMEQVYDLTVPETHNFVANDVCVHNTAMALNAIWHASGEKKMPVAIFSLEMSKEQLVQRLISQTTRIPAQALRSGNVKAEDWPKLLRGVAQVSEAPIWIDDTAGVTLMEMRAKVRRLASQLGAAGGPPLSLVVVDYLQLMIGQGSRNDNRQQEIAEISRGLKVLARDLDVPVLAIAQLSRAVESRHDKRPMLSDLRDCLPANALVTDADTGERLPIKKIVDEALRPNVWAIDDDLRLVRRRVVDAWAVGRKNMVEVELRSGLLLRCTGGHRLLGETGWTRAEDLAPGQRVGLPRRQDEPSHALEDDPRKWLLCGWLLGDGYLKGSAALTTATAAEARYAAWLGKTVFGIKPVVKPERASPTARRVVFTTGGLTGAGKNSMTRWLRQIGAWGHTGWRKSVPEAIWSRSDASIEAFLRGLFHADGSLTRSGRAPNVRLATVSERLARDVQLLLLRLGIRASVHEHSTAASGYRPTAGTSWVVYVGGIDNVRTFARRVGFLGSKHSPLARCLKRERRGFAGSLDRVPILANDRVREIKADRDLSWSELGWREQGKLMSREKARELGARLDDPILGRFGNSDVLWEEVRTVRAAGREQAYDITVEDVHNFAVDGFITHNSGAIEQDADMVMFLYRDEYYNPDSDDKGIAEVIVGKHRNGPTGKVQLAWLEQYTKFASLARRG